MCIGIPMQVLRTEPGHAWVAGRGEVKRVDTALIDEPHEGEWLLVFLDAARERIAADRAAEVNGVLDLLQGALAGSSTHSFDEVGFALPSRMDPSALAALAGRTAPEPLPE